MFQSPMKNWSTRGKQFRTHSQKKQTLFWELLAAGRTCAIAEVVDNPIVARATCLRRLRASPAFTQNFTQIRIKNVGKNYIFLMFLSLVHFFCYGFELSKLPISLLNYPNHTYWLQHVRFELIKELIGLNGWDLDSLRTKYVILVVQWRSRKTWW